MREKWGLTIFWAGFFGSLFWVRWGKIAPGLWRTALEHQLNEIRRHGNLNSDERWCLGTTLKFESPMAQPPGHAVQRKVESKAQDFFSDFLEF